MEELLAAAESLSALVRGSYGPSGDEVLVFAPPDPPLITADGYAVLRAKKEQITQADTPSPFERVILDAAEGVYREVGDGTTQFVVMIHSLLRHICAEASGGRLDVTERVHMARALGELRHRWTTGTLVPRDELACVLTEDRWEINVARTGVVRLSPAITARATQVLQTALTGTLGRRIVPQIVELVMEWVFGALRMQEGHRIFNPARFLHRHLQQYLQHATRAILHANGGSITSSYVLDHDEFVIRKSLIPSQLHSILGTSDTLRFVCFTSSFDLTAGSNQIEYQISSNAEGLTALDHLRIRLMKFLADLREYHQVGLVISTEKIEDYVAATCNHLQIACVQYAETDDVAALCSITGMCALTSVVDKIEDDIHIGVCSHGTLVRHSQNAVLRLRGLQTRPNTERGAVRQLMIYASSKGVFKQYYNAILKSLRVLRCLFDQPDGHTVHFCSGAGATELAMAKYLRYYEQSRAQRGAADPSLDRAMRSLSASLIESVVCLRTNLTQGCGGIDRERVRRQSTRALLEEMSFLRSQKATTPQGYILDMNHSIPTTLGSVGVPKLIQDDPFAHHIVHPWQRMEMVIQTVLQTAEQLLRVDGVVRIRRHPTTKWILSEDDNQEE